MSTWGSPWVHNLAAVGGRGAGAALVVRQVVNNTVGVATDQRAAVAVDPRAGDAEVAADCLAVGSPPVRTRCSCPAAASAGAAVGDDDNTAHSVQKDTKSSVKFMSLNEEHIRT